MHFTTRRVWHVWLIYFVLVFHRFTQFGWLKAGGVAEESAKRLGRMANPHERELGRIDLVVLNRRFEFTNRTPLVPRDGA